METKLSVTTGARRLSLRSLAITAMLVAGFAITASGASAAMEATEGMWTVRPGRTLELANMSIRSPDTDTAYVYVDGSRILPALGTTAPAIDHPSGCYSNAVPPCAVFPPNFFYTNPAGSNTTHTVTMDLYDATVGCDSFSFGPNAAASHPGPLRPGQFWDFSIQDGSLTGACDGPARLGDTIFDGNVFITRTP